jgi:hypothetical protein
MNKKYDVSKLRARIAELPICSDGKDGVTALVEELIGEKLSAEEKPKFIKGQVWLVGGTQPVIITDEDNYVYFDKGSEMPLSQRNMSIHSKTTVFAANSLKEFLQSKEGRKWLEK